MTIRRKVTGLIRLFRPELPAAAGMCVVLGEVLALGGLPPVGKVILGFLCGFFLSGSALITNDVFDLEVDRVNAPGRPLPSGLVSPSEAMAAGLLVGLAGLVTAWFFQPLAVGLGLIVWCLGFLYNWKLKAAGLWGNLIVCTSVGLTFVLGGMGAGRPWSGVVWVFAAIAFLFDLAEEIAGDAMDAEGDRQRNSRSIAIVWGRQPALYLSAGLFMLVIGLTLVPVALGWLGLPYLFIMGIVDGLIIYFAAHLLKSQAPAEGRRWMRRLYISASLGLLAFLIGVFVV